MLPALVEIARDLERGRAPVEREDVSVVDKLGRGKPDRTLGLDLHLFAIGKREFEGRYAGALGAPMDGLDQPRLFQRMQVAADRHLGDAELARQVGNRHGVTAHDLVDNALPSLYGEDRGE